MGLCSALEGACSVCSAVEISALSAPPWRSPDSSAPPWWAPVPPVPPWGAPVPPAVPLWALIPSVPPWWAPVSSAQPWWAHGLVCSALVGSSSALVGSCLVCCDLVGSCLVCSNLVGSCLICSALVGSGLLCLGALPALPRFLVLPHGPGPPSLPRFHLRSTALLDCSMCGASGSRSFGGGGGSVTNPVHELTPTHHISCTTLQLHITQGLHFPSTIALITQLSLICTNYTASLHQARFISLGLHLSHCEVLFSPV